METSGHKTRDLFDRYHIVLTTDLHAAMRGVETASLALPTEGTKKKSRTPFGVRSVKSTDR